MKQKSNKQFMVLSVIGIIVMLFCHLGRSFFNYLMAFPFIVIFIFISGYFYKKEKEEKVSEFIWHKFKKLMIPFFIINLIYGIIVNIFKAAGVVNYGSPITLYTLFIQPFINNNQFVLTFPAWFVPTLFLVNVCYILIHKFAGKTKFLNDYVLLVVFSILNIVTVCFKEICLTNGFAMIVFKILFFLPFFQFGYLYKEKWQKYDENVQDILYLLALFIINFAIRTMFGSLIYDMHDFEDFETNIVFIPLITSIISILFYTRIAKILSKWIGENKLINYISNNTSSIMTHHLFIIFLFNCILYTINLHVTIPYFYPEVFQTGWICIYEVPGWIMLQQLLYVAMGLFGSLLIHFVYDKARNKIKDIQGGNKNE